MRCNGLHLPEWGICHGARSGRECDEFSFQFPKTRVFGTDLFPELGKAKYQVRSKVVAWNFSDYKEGWMEKFDFVYSNSLDHARSPIETVGIWLSQLKPEGVLFVQWSAGHTTVKGGDCFGADLLEYIDLMNTVGRVQDLLYINVPRRRHALQKRGREVVVLVVSKK